MKLASIYNIWDGTELLKGSIDCIINDVDVVIIVLQKISNHGEYYNPIDDMPYVNDLKIKPIVLFFDVNPYKTASENETAKRQMGINYAKQLKCTHFLSMDCDEYYENFTEAKIEYEETNPNGGSACKILTYFKSPTLRFEKEDNYFVPFIHKLNQNTTTGFKNYPFYADPTRRINEMNVIEIKSQKMHHYSWVRKDILRKIKNSSANLARSPKILQDYYSPETKEGYYVEGFHQTLIEVPNQFNIQL